VNLKGIRNATSRIALTAFILVIGIFILAGYFFPVSILTNLRIILLNLAVVVAGFAVLAGIANLLNVHVKKIRRKQKGSFYSTILIIALAITFLLGIAAPSIPVVETLFADTFNYIQLPVEATLMGILAITLTYASIRLLRRRLNVLSIVFLVTVLIILFGTAFLSLLGMNGAIIRLFDQVFATAGARGILIGVALGMLVTGLRVLFGADRPIGAK
jgi:hypothetical protein